MRYRLMGRSGLRVSEVGLGAMTFSDRGLTWGATLDQAHAIFDAFAEAGGTFVDTANVYGDARGGGDGASERVLADLLSADREHFVLATKYTGSNSQDVSRSGNSAKSMRGSVDRSLRNLRTDHLDLLWLHTWDGTTPVDEVLRAADQLVTAGKLLYFGFSDTPAWVVSQAVAIADVRGTTPPIAVQIEYSIAERTPEREVLPMSETLDLGVAAWGPLAAGLLTGKYTRRPDGADGSGTGTGTGGGTGRFSDEHWAGLAGGPPRDRLEIARVVDRVADRLHRPSAHVALAWLRQRPGVIVPILGARDRAQLEENLAGLDLVLDERDMAVLAEASRPSLGFPQALLARETIREFSTSGHYGELVNHHAHHYAEFAV